MGLDSIELVIDIEKFFGIQIPDREAEKIYSVQLMADAVARLSGVVSGSILLRNRVFALITDALKKSGYTGMPVSVLHSLDAALSLTDNEQWQVFSSALGMEVPKPSKEEWPTLSFGLLTDAVGMANYRSLIDGSNIISRYEVYIAVGGITVDKTGVSYYEIAPEKSFTDDLGID